MAELMFRDGDYVSDGKGGLRTVEDEQALLQRVLWKLSVRRGSFLPLPELGSELYRLGRVKPAGRAAAAQQYVTQALADETELTVIGVTLEQQGDRGELTAALAWRGEELTVNVELGGLG